MFKKQTSKVDVNLHNRLHYHLMYRTQIDNSSLNIVHSHVSFEE